MVKLSLARDAAIIIALLVVKNHVVAFLASIKLAKNGLFEAYLHLFLVGEEVDGCWIEK